MEQLAIGSPAHNSTPAYMVAARRLGIEPKVFVKGQDAAINSLDVPAEYLEFLKSIKQD